MIDMIYLLSSGGMISIHLDLPECLYSIKPRYPIVASRLIQILFIMDKCIVVRIILREKRGSRRAGLDDFIIST